MKAEFDKAAALDDFNRWFEGSKVVGANGEPLVVFHGTAHLFSPNSFNCLSHFGSAKAANTFSPLFMHKYKQFLNLPVFLKLCNPLIIKDMIIHPYYRYKKFLRVNGEKGVFDLLKLEEVMGSELYNDDLDYEPSNWQASIAKAFIKLGYDGLMYKNDHEDSGSVSYIIFDASQVRPAIPLNGILPQKSYYLSKDVMRPFRPLTGLQQTP